METKPHIKPDPPRFSIGVLGALIGIFDGYAGFAESWHVCPPDYNLYGEIILSVCFAGSPIVVLGAIGAIAALTLPKRIRFVLLFSPLVFLAAWPIVAGLPHAVPAIGTEPCPIPDF